MRVWGTYVQMYNKYEYYTTIYANHSMKPVIYDCTLVPGMSILTGGRKHGFVLLHKAALVPPLIVTNKKWS